MAHVTGQSILYTCPLTSFSWVSYYLLATYQNNAIVIVQYTAHSAAWMVTFCS
jgi:hypothetical protein